MGGVGRVAGDSILSASGKLQDKAISGIQGLGMPALLTDKAVSAIQQGVPMLTDKAISGVQKFTESPTFNNNPMSRILPSYVSYNNPALNAQLDRESTFNMNERKIPDIGPTKIDDQGAGTLNLAVLGENKTGVSIGNNAATGSTKMGGDQAQRIINDFIKNWIVNPNRGKQSGRRYLGETMDKILDDYGRGKDEATRKKIHKGIVEAVYNTRNKKVIRDWQDFDAYTDIIDEEFGLGNYSEDIPEAIKTKYENKIKAWIRNPNTWDTLYNLSDEMDKDNLNTQQQDEMDDFIENLIYKSNNDAAIETYNEWKET
jgi:hypothetical protein